MARLQTKLGAPVVDEVILRVEAPVHQLCVLVGVRPGVAAPPFDQRQDGGQVVLLQEELECLNGEAVLSERVGEGEGEEKKLSESCFHVSPVPRTR